QTETARGEPEVCGRDLEGSAESSNAHWAASCIQSQADLETTNSRYERPHSLHAEDAREGHRGGYRATKFHRSQHGQLSGRPRADGTGIAEPRGQRTACHAVGRKTHYRDFKSKLRRRVRSRSSWSEGGEVRLHRRQRHGGRDEPGNPFAYI